MAATNGAAIADSQGVGTITNDDNTPPVARDDNISAIAVGAVISVYPLSNDTDADGHALTLTSYAPSSSPISASWNAASRRMQISASFAGSYWITYTVSDGFGGTDTASINITVNPAQCVDPLCSPDADPGGGV